MAFDDGRTTVPSAKNCARSSVLDEIWRDCVFIRRLSGTIRADLSPAAASKNLEKRVRHVRRALMATDAVANNF
ncbi:Uncharacterised protein [BD1-7 clade bacterium]|uniref:Uncharacterized protein n=1 Tax=BD1-7 clade bacterium TaxID=2029982 RepID=A0A5S9QB12_9GAMM|nr:Uncharacterised protein [BD1-7 clade bacterium]